jgi:hypothetical protein
MKPAELLQHINAIHGTAFTLVERYEQGEQGAFAIVDPNERRYVLKWQPRLGLIGGRKLTGIFLCPPLKRLF